MKPDQEKYHIWPKHEIKCDQCGTDFAPFRSYNFGRFSKILMFPRFYAFELLNMLRSGRLFPEAYFDCPKCSAGMQHKMNVFRY